MKYGDKGPEVREMQERLLALGYELPKYGADGHFGDETRAALKEYADDNWEAFEEDVADHVMNRDLDYMDNVDDLRSQQSNPPAKANKFKIENGKVVERDMSDVDGVVLHQTAVWYGVSQNQINAAGGDKHQALHNRGLDVACHAIAYGGQGANLEDVCGHAIATNPLNWYVYHGNGLNSRSLGLEIEGDYPGLIGSSEEVPDNIIQAAKDALRYLVEEGRRLGAPIKYLWAHRQSSDTRRGDPGEEIWKKVGLDYGVKVLGLETQPEKVWGSGYPIPVEWDPDGTGNY